VKLRKPVTTSQTQRACVCAGPGGHCPSDQRFFTLRTFPYKEAFKDLVVVAHRVSGTRCRPLAQAEAGTIPAIKLPPTPAPTMRIAEIARRIIVAAVWVRGMPSPFPEAKTSLVI
jgi:hypothetical protein